MLHIYVATAYEAGREVEYEIVPKLRRHGLVACSTWHVGEHTPEDLEGMIRRHGRDEGLCRIRAIATANDHEVELADALLLIPHPRGREMWAELRLALESDVPVFYVDRADQRAPMLSAYRQGVAIVASVDEAIAAMVRLRDDDSRASYEAIFGVKPATNAEGASS